MRFILFLVLLGSFGCFYEEPKLRVEVCGDALIPDDIDAFRISIWDENLENELVSGTRELLRCPGPDFLALPQEVEFNAIEGETWIRVQGLRNGESVSSFWARQRTDADESGEVRVSITRACLGIQCAVGQTCVDGQCVLAEYQPASSICSSSAMVAIPEREPITYCAGDMAPEETDG